jgi:hypothetical protein
MTLVKELQELLAEYEVNVREYRTEELCDVIFLNYSIEICVNQYRHTIWV